MNEDITTAEELVEEVEIQALSELDECIDTLTVSYQEFNENRDDKELEEIYIDAINDLKTLLGDYCPEDDSIVQEAYENLFEEVVDSLK